MYVEFSFGMAKHEGLLSATKKVKLATHEQPYVSIIISARNEESTIGNTLQLLVEQCYKNYEVIIINDRSTDNTQDIIFQFSEQYNCFKSYTVKHLPSGWLGKNFSMYTGAKLAKAEWILFMDADVQFKPELLSRSFAYIKKQQLDNLTIIPDLQGNHFWLDVMINSGFVAFFLQQKPWRARFKNQKYYAGVGAFNLLKKADYFNFDGHKSFPFCVLDDLKLGKKIKEQGLNQACVDGQGLLKVDWYYSVSAMIKGLEKNAYAYCHYQLLILVGQTVLGISLYFLPLAGLFNRLIIVKLLSVASIFTTIALYRLYVKSKNLPLIQAFVYPIGVLLGLYACWRSAYKIERQRGIKWRDTFYSLNSLKKDLL